MGTSTMQGNDDRPVTRAELRSELEPFATRAELRSELEPFATKAELRSELERFATKADLAELALRLDAFATKADLAELALRLDAFATKADLSERLESFAALFMRATQQQLDTAATATRQHIDAVAERLSAEIARASLAGGEQTRREIGVLDDRYRDLPGRMALLERELDEHRRDATAHRPARPRRRS